ncbi:MAG: hypothetical protein HYX79_01750 [Chloroflexi bacterium]|nr:hypothetical protein [Chloroflexota bacterium]
MDYYQCKQCKIEFLENEKGCSECGTTQQEIRCPACGSKEVEKTGEYGRDRNRDWDYRPVRFG